MRGAYQGKKSQYNKNGAKKDDNIDVTFILLSKDQVGIQIPYSLMKEDVRNIVKVRGQGSWCHQKKNWIIQRQNYEKVLKQLREYFNNYNNQSNSKIVKVIQVEKFVQKAQKLLFTQMQKLQIINKKDDYHVINYNKIQTSIQPQTVPFYNKLFQFQKQSLKFGIQKHGRMLLADEMGVGKTIQSLAVAYVYYNQWPLLIICPTSLKLNWKQEIQNWYKNTKETNVQIINNGKPNLKKNANIFIVSYDLAWRIIQIFKDIKIVIADQAHYLKSQNSNRSQILVPYLSKRKRVMLLTGTPAFARPKQIFNLIKIIRPDVFNKFRPFGNRYCDPCYNPWSSKYQYAGCKNTSQLFYLLKNTIMIRRLKQDVLKQLPDKNRQKINVETDPKIVKQIQNILSQSKVQKIQTFFQDMACYQTKNQNFQQDDRQDIMMAYIKSGQAKIKAIKQYISQILQNNIKILVFAHHQKILNELQEEVKKLKINYIRIDGNVSLSQRHENVQKFQKDSTVLVALLSITAAGVGLTLTAASTVIFAQLHWTPALMIQAQDRAHRVGQKSSVNCHYLIGQNTLDDILYKFLQRKIKNVSSFIDGKQNDFNSEALPKGVMGKISKKQQQIKNSSFNFQSVMPIIGRNSYRQESNMTQVTDISSQSSIGNISRKKMPQSFDYDLKQQSKPMMSILKQQSNEFGTQQKQNQEDNIKSHSENLINEKKQQNQQEQDEDQYFYQLIKAIKSKKDPSSLSNNQQSARLSNTQTQTLSIKTTQSL